jgi:hypothetical protein
MKKRQMVATVLSLSVVAGRPAEAQWLVHDPAHFTKALAISATAQQILDTIDDTLLLMKRWARRLAVLGAVPDRYVPQDVPRWRTWRQDHPTPEALGFMEALNAGVRPGGAVAVSPVRPQPDSQLPLPESVKTGLALLDVADSVLVAGADQTGRIRGGRRSEVEALLALGHVVADVTGSTTARVAVLSAGAMIGRRQDQSKLGLTTSIVEQLIVEAMNKRQVELAAMHMRQTGLEPGLNILDGSAGALRSWRQP